MPISVITVVSDVMRCFAVQRPIDSRGKFKIPLAAVLTMQRVDVAESCPSRYKTSSCILHRLKALHLHLCIDEAVLQRFAVVQASDDPSLD
jgi:hypothetical protein